jgi:hypothetical protein
MARSTYVTVTHGLGVWLYRFEVLYALGSGDVHGLIITGQRQCMFLSNIGRSRYRIVALVFGLIQTVRSRDHNDQNIGTGDQRNSTTK